MPATDVLSALSLLRIRYLMAAPSAARSSRYFSVLGAPTRRRVPPPHNPDRQSRQAPPAPSQHHHSVRGLLLTVAHRPHWPDGGHYTSIADAAVPDATSFGWCALTAEQRDLCSYPADTRHPKRRG